jgi:putative transposase
VGLLRVVVVHAASVQAREGAQAVLAQLTPRFLRVRLIGADGGSAGALLTWVARSRPRNPLRLEIVKRADTDGGFVVQPKRWIVERTSGWLTRYRRLSQDSETLPATSEAMIDVAMIRLMLACLA